MIAWFATKGSGTNEAKRIETLLSRIEGTEEWPFDKSAKLSSARRLWRALMARRPELIVMEGTGLTGGLFCLAARLFLKIPYVFSSGDAVAPFIRAHYPFVGLLFEIYERMLCRCSAGFIGWTPYLCGRAMTFGAARAMTAPGWVIGGGGNEKPERNAWRAKWGIPQDAIVVGLVGSLEWNHRRQWCYGMDLVTARRRIAREDLCVLVVGGGSGLEYLRKAAGDLLDKKIFLPGPVPLEMVVPSLAVMDVASLPQSVDGVGSFRYTTKLPEYAAARLPVITNRVPMAYELGHEWMWRLGGDAPWDESCLKDLERLLSGLDHAAIEAKRQAIPNLQSLFDTQKQIDAVTDFIRDILEDARNRDGR